MNKTAAAEVAETRFGSNCHGCIGCALRWPWKRGLLRTVSYHG